MQGNQWNKPPMCQKGKENHENAQKLASNKDEYASNINISIKTNRH